MSNLFSNPVLPNLVVVVILSFKYALFCKSFLLAFETYPITCAEDGSV